MQDIGILAGLIGGVWALLLWLSITVWVYRDIRERTRDLGLQVLAVFVGIMFFPGFNIPGLALYLMLRPRDSLEEAYARSLEEEALLREIGDEGMCPSCRHYVEQGWRVCPYCATQLKDVCVTCEHLLSFNWIACPFCATERRGVQEPLKEPEPAPSAAPAAPTLKQERESVAKVAAADDEYSQAGGPAAPTLKQERESVADVATADDESSQAGGREGI